MLKRYVGCNKAWEEVRSDIEAYCAEVLRRIEWYYGEGRAPYKFPPDFYGKKRSRGKFLYGCIIELDMAGEGELRYESGNTADLSNKVKEDIRRRFMPEPGG